ncbi:MAG: hypothetical protein ACTSUE_16115 [Promethearchaeota archaeon]
MRKEDEHALANKLEGISWKKNSITGGYLEIKAGIYVEFEFKGYPNFKLFPKNVRKQLPPIIEILPELVLWDEDDAPSWSRILEKLRNKVKNLLSVVGDGSSKSEQVQGGIILLSGNMMNGLQGLAKSAYPNEILLLLRRSHDDVFSEVIMPQGAKGGKTAAYFSPSRLPFDQSLQGSYHSHPGGSGKSSQQDLRMFKRYPVNIIGYPPFGKKNFKVYDNIGNEINYKVM